jgi:polar amino acid transport system ATP-binding protein
MAFLEVKDIYKSFGKVEVLKGVSFSLEEGEVLSIIGSSGNGKTTLLRCLNYLETIDEGEVCLEGKVINFGGMTKKIKEDEKFSTVSRRRVG